MGPTGSSGMIRSRSNAGTVRAGGWARLAILAALVAFPRVAAGSPLELYGFGGRSPGTGRHRPDRRRRLRQHVSQPGGARPRSAASGSPSATSTATSPSSSTAPTPAPSARAGSCSAPRCRCRSAASLEDRVGLGLGFFVPTGTLTRVRVPLPGDPVYALLETRSQTLGILLASGVRLGDRWRRRHRAARAGRPARLHLRRRRRRRALHHRLRAAAHHPLRPGRRRHLGPADAAVPRCRASA